MRSFFLNSLFSDLLSPNISPNRQAKHITLCFQNILPHRDIGHMCVYADLAVCLLCIQNI